VVGLQLPCYIARASQPKEPMSTHSRTFAVALLVLLLTAAWLLWPEPDSPPVVPPPTTPTSAAEPADAAGASMSAPSSLVERSEAPTAAPPASTVDPLFAHVRGRCVDEHGAPLPSSTVALDAWGGNQNRMAMQGKVDWQDPEPIVTGADGRFDFAFAPPSGMQFSLDVKAEGRVPRTGRWGQLQPAQIVDVGDIRLTRGLPVRGRVVDERGAPVAKVGISINNLPLPIAADMAANNSRSGWSDGNGNFAIEVPIPPGTWSIDAQARGMRLVSPTHVTITEGGAEPVLVTVRSMPSIQGLVVDEQGQPVKGVEIRAVSNRSGRYASGRSRDDGTFTIFAVDAEPQPVPLRVDDPGPCEPPATSDERLWAWGSTDVRFQLQRALTCELLVVERATGAPVISYAVSCASARSNSSLQSELRLAGEHEGGRVIIDRIWRGKNTLQVIPLDPALLPSARIEFEATDAGVPPQRIEVERLQPAAVRVTTAAGAPVIGSKVEVLVKGTMPFDAGSFVQDSRGGNRGFSSDPKTRFHELLGRVISDQDGKAAVFVPSNQDGLVVRVTGDHPPALVDPANFVPGQELVVVPPTAGSIVGAVRVTGLEPSRIRISRHRGEPGPRTNFDQPVALQGDGTFVMGGLLPGRYQLRLDYAVPFRSEHGGQTGSAALDLPAIDVVVQADEATKLDIDATALVPASVRGRVLLDGAPPSAARIVLRSRRAQYGQFVPGGDGTFTAEGLLPGQYDIDLVVGDFVAAEGDTIAHEASFELAAGQQLARDFVFVRRRIVITLLQADGSTPAAHVACMLHGDGVRLRDQTTDAQGRIVVDPAPVVPFRVQPRSVRVALGPVQIPIGRTSHEVTLTLPATAK
jgi:Carboxypeptidase regulatory-like domain